MVIRERFTRGFVTGTIAGAVSSLADYLSHLLGIVELPYVEWAAVLLYGHRLRNIGEAIIAQLGQLFFRVFWGWDLPIFCGPSIQKTIGSKGRFTALPFGFPPTSSQSSFG